MDRDKPAGEINQIGQFTGNWEWIPVTVDSGAIDSVIPRHIAKGVPIRETTASKNGLRYRAANGTPPLIMKERG